MNIRPITNPWTPDWANPVFSLQERDARWAKVRRLMARDGIDLIVCMPCTNSHDRGQADPRYLTQLGENSDEVTVAFPIEGEPTAWHSRGGVWPSSNWFGDVRATLRGTGGATICSWLDENPRYKTGTIAIAALDSSVLAHVRTAEGEVNWQSVDILKKTVSTARYVSATTVLGEARWQKSAEEIEFLRKGTKVAEATLDAAHETARAGVSERHVFAKMMYASAEAGGSFAPMFGWATGPLGQPYHRLEQPSLRNFQTGDVFNIEIEGRWGGHISQIDQTLIIGPASQDLKDAIQDVDRGVRPRLRPDEAGRHHARADCGRHDHRHERARSHRARHARARHGGRRAAPGGRPAGDRTRCSIFRSPRVARSWSSRRPSSTDRPISPNGATRWS